MRIAVISDIHANLPALEEVLNGIDSQNVDLIYCLGDLVTQNVWNNEVVELIRKRKIPTVRGNHDEALPEGVSSSYVPGSMLGEGGDRLYAAYNR